MPFSTIAVKLQLIIPKTNKKDKIEDQKNLFANFIFLKVVNNVRVCFWRKRFYII